MLERCHLAGLVTERVMNTMMWFHMELFDIFAMQGSFIFGKWPLVDQYVDGSVIST